MVTKLSTGVGTHRRLTAILFLRRTVTQTARTCGTLHILMAGIQCRACSPPHPPVDFSLMLGAILMAKLPRTTTSNPREAAVKGLLAKPYPFSRLECHDMCSKYAGVVKLDVCSSPPSPTASPTQSPKHDDGSRSPPAARWLYTGCSLAIYRRNRSESAALVGVCKLVQLCTSKALSAPPSANLPYERMRDQTWLQYVLCTAGKRVDSVDIPWYISPLFREKTKKA